MTDSNLLKEAHQLEDRIASANSSVRLALQPEFHKVLLRLRTSGASVPQSMRQLDATLCEEATEARFDNLPV
jgi:hypothetical protein